MKPYLIILSILLAFVLNTSWAHFENTPDDQINAWDKLVIEVKYDEKEGSIQIRGHSHHPDNTVIIVTLKNIYEKEVALTQEVRVKGKFFSCAFGPFISGNKKPAPGYFEITAWFIHKRQAPDMQKILDAKKFYNCAPPCPIDYQHYQQDVIQIGTDEEIETEFDESMKQYERWIAETFKVEKDAKRYLAKLLRNARRGGVTWDSARDEYLEKRQEYIGRINEIREQIEELRNEKSLIYFDKILDDIFTPLSEVLTLFSQAKRVLNGTLKNKRKVDELMKNMENFSSKGLKTKLKEAVQEAEKEDDDDDEED